MKLKTFIHLFPVIFLLLTAGHNWKLNMNSYQNLAGDKDPYKKQWAKVDSLDKLGLPRSALKIVNIIHDSAIKEGIHDQIIKSMIYRMKYLNMVEEDAFEAAVTDMEKQIKTATFPDKNMMHSILAEMYWMYYQNNRWKFYNRTQTVNFDNGKDIKTWDLNKLANQVIKHYLLSLEHADSLKTKSVDVYDEVIVDFESTKKYRPTLFDFFANRAINFFKNKELTLTRPADKFMLQEDYYFAPVEEFVNKKIETSDTLSLQFYGIKIIQSLLKYRLSEPNHAAFIKADLDRLNFVETNSVNDLKDSLYLSALKRLESKYPDEEISAEVSYLIAYQYYTNASKYNPEDKKTNRYKNNFITAKKKCEETIMKYQGSSGAIKCQNLIYDIENTNLTLTTEEVYTGNNTIPALINYRNTFNAYIRIATIDKNKLEKLQGYLWGSNLYDKLLKESKIVKNYSFNLPKENDFREHSTEILLDGLNYGYYIVFVSDNPQFSYNKNIAGYSFFNVSNIAFVSRNNNDGSYDFYVSERNSGVPLQGVTAKKWIRKYDYKSRKYIKINTETFTSDKNGNVHVSYNSTGNSYFMEFIKGEDHLYTKNSYYSYNYNNKSEPRYITTIYTDRAIYRPGQTIYFKGITLKQNNDKYDIADNYSVDVILYDVNYQKVTELNLVTNEFGSFSGTFSIPTGLLNGQMQIYTESGSKYVSVEEYKRPKFETKLLPFDGNYILNDTVKVKGNAVSYSGAYLTDADVTYRIVRTPVWRGWWSWYWGYNYSETEIANGKTTTNSKGEYKLQFMAKPDLSMGKSQYLDFNYKIYVDVTDINGETQSTQSSITVGYTALKLDVDIPASLLKSEADTFKISTTNLNGEHITASGHLNVYLLEDSEKPLKSRLWSKPDHFIYTKEQWNEKLPGMVYDNDYNITSLKEIKKIYSVDFNTDKTTVLNLKNMQKWQSGRYKVKMVAKDAFGNEVLQEKFFTLYTDQNGKNPYKTIDWYSPVKVSGEPGEKAKILIGTGLQNVKVLCQVENKNKIISTEWYNLNNEQKLLEFEIKEEYRGNFSIHFCFIKDNRFYSHTQLITVPYSNKDLDIEFETFRNKLYPGEKEEWRIKIKGPKGEKVAAEMLATLYDASLDQFKKNDWYFNIYPYYSSTRYLSPGMFYANSSQMIKKGFNNDLTVPYEQVEYLNWFGFNYYGRYYYSYRTTGAIKTKNGRNDITMSSEVEDIVENTKEMSVEEEKPISETNTAALVGRNTVADMPAKEQQHFDTDQEDTGVKLDEVHARTNFNETAFFFPNLLTNEDGEIIVSFTVPESLTKWKMMGFAHTKDLKYGFINNELVTQKELMVVPNAPRFFREYDKIEFPVKINNLTEDEMNGVVRIELFDALTMKTVDNILDKSEKADKKFTIDAKGNTVVTWKLNIPEGIQAIDYKVVAKAGKYSDGEEKVLPVLTNRMLVTETLPLPIRGNQTKEFHFVKLLNSGKSKTLRHERYTLEFTSNPAWYAVQALPYLMEYPYECSEQVFSRFYANTLASHIANSNPKIKNVFDSWKNTPDSKSLLSNLEKNQELKSVLLEETPWVLNARNETERKKRVGLLFDLNRMSDELGRVMIKLQKMQSYNGGWPWFEGMPESRYITQHIITGMGHLDHLGITDIRQDKSVWKMVKKGVNYLDIRILEDYNNLKKYYNDEEMTKKHIGYTQIQYLYARSYFKDINIPTSTKEAYNYYLNQAKKYWLSQSKYMQGMIALALHRYNENKIALDIIKSLKEHSITDEEMGMYWKEPGGFYWYQAPIERQALMIEAFDEVANDQNSVEDLKVWLLKQKQTQDWKTTKATVEAIYALLLKGTDILASDQLVEIKIGDKKIEPKQMENVKVEAGTGYFKTSWSGSEIKPEMGNISVAKKDEGVAWGAVYWQYFEQLDKITPHETPLKMTKKLFIEANTESGKVIKPISDKNTLKVGDKVIVRIEIKVDRAMEYVHMKDMRASGFEPINVISRYKYQGGLGYYESTKDAATNFFISYLPKGTYVFEYPLRVQHKGDFSNGITSIQCMYAPEFASHSEGIRVQVE